MKLSERWYRRLERFYLAQRRVRQEETKRQVEEQDRALRSWADQALVAHNAGRCVPRCPFRHDLPLV